jgi:hypothetical protein
MGLKAVEPHEAQPPKVKLMISGEAGTGKTWFSLDFPKPYLIDAESGAVRKQYQDKLKKVGGAYFGHEQGSDCFDDVINEVRTLCTEKHDYKTLVIDSFSHLYLMEAAEAELKIGSDFGKDKKAANIPTRQLMRWVNKCPMNVILICHSKPKWARKGNEIYQDGNTFEGYGKMEYDLDLWVEIMKGHKNFLIKKSRIESLPQDEMMPLDYRKFAEVYGEEALEKEIVPTKLASKGHIKAVNKFVEILNVDESTIQKWHKKVDCSDFSEYTVTQIEGLIKTLEKKVDGLKESK